MKKLLTIITTAILTLILGAGGTWLFKDKLLHLAALDLISQQELISLRKDSHKVKALKQHHKNRKKIAPKRYAKRVGKKVISTSAAMATVVGAAAVPVIVIAYELEDYCTEQQDLFEIEQILFEQTLAVFDFDACINNAKRDIEDLGHETDADISESIDKIKVEAKILLEQFRLRRDEILAPVFELLEE